MSSSRTLCVLPQLVQEALCTAPATRNAGAAPAAATRVAARPGGSVHCACHAKKAAAAPAAVTRAAASPGLSVYCALQEPLCIARAKRARCTAPATRKAAAAPAAATRAAARPGGSVYCACHAKGSRGPSGGHAAAAPPGCSVYCACHAKSCCGPSGGHTRRSSSRTLCVLRLPPDSAEQGTGATQFHHFLAAFCHAKALVATAATFGRSLRRGP